MTLHLYMEHECTEKDCDCTYVPYDDSIVCPKCKHKPEVEDYPELIEGICESFLYNLGEYGCFVPAAWITMDISDNLQGFLFSVFSKWTLEELSDHEPQTRTKAFEQFLNALLEKVDFDEQDYMSNYIRDLALAVYNEFFDIRGINLLVAGKEIKVVK